MELGSEFRKIVLLFDNIDKGWPARKVEPHDIRTIQHLVAILNKVQRELERRDMAFQHMLFVRSDVYEEFVEETADRAKQNLITTDWSDPEQLTHLIHQRVISAIGADSRAEAWQVANPTLDDGRTAVAHMIESSLMRPRFLIELCERAISFAVNRGHAGVMPEDVRAALEKHSIYLVSFLVTSCETFLEFRTRFFMHSWATRSVWTKKKSTVSLPKPEMDSLPPRSLIC